MRQILIRFDDICPTMDYNQWGRAVELMDKYSVKPLIGVVPDCKDPDLMIETPHSDFWEYVKQLEAKGYTLALHGLYHVYDSQTRGIVNHSWHSEYAGHSYEKQVEKIRRGKEILLKHGISTDVFFAPAHSYDLNTLKALYANGFRYLSDGATLKPILMEGIKCLPCHFSGAKVPFFKYETVVFHAHEWGKKENDDEYKLLKRLCENHRDEIVDFKTFSEASVGNRNVQLLYQNIYVWYDRHIWPMIVNIYQNIVRR